MIDIKTELLALHPSWMSHVPVSQLMELHCKISLKENITLQTSTMKLNYIFWFHIDIWYVSCVK